MSKYIENKNLIENCEIHKKQYECYCSNCKYHLCKECLKSKKHKADKKLYFYELQPNDDEIIRIEDKIKYYQDEAVKLEIERKVSFEEGKKFAEEKSFLFQEVSAKNGKNFETLFEKQIFDEVYKKFKSEFDKREKMGYEDDQANNETNENTNKPADNKLKLESNNNTPNVKKKKKCC